MPNYTYRSKDPACAGFTAFESISNSPQASCPNCGASVYRAITLASTNFKFRQGMKGDMRDYRDDLARFAGDPEAYVDGPKSVEKLKDKRKRQGWQLGKHFEPLSQPKTKTSDQIARESYERAQAKGFIPDADA